MVGTYTVPLAAVSGFRFPASLQETGKPETGNGGPKHPATEGPSEALMIDPDEPAEHAAERAVMGVGFAIALLKRLRRRLPGYLHPGGTVDPARAIVAAARVQAALATIAPAQWADHVGRVRRQLAAAREVEALLGGRPKRRGKRRS
jgi:hypothetical protein